MEAKAKRRAIHPVRVDHLTDSINRDIQRDSVTMQKYKDLKEDGMVTIMQQRLADLREMLVRIDLYLWKKV